jgi:hypothetical protein
MIRNYKKNKTACPRNYTEQKKGKMIRLCCQSGVAIAISVDNEEPYQLMELFIIVTCPT